MSGKPRASFQVVKWTTYVEKVYIEFEYVSKPVYFIVYSVDKRLFLTTAKLAEGLSDLATTTVKPRPEAHMDMIPFEVFFEEYPLDSTRPDSTMTLSII